MNGKTKNESENENETDTLLIQSFAEEPILLVSVDAPSSTSTQVPSASLAGNLTLVEISEIDDGETMCLCVCTKAARRFDNTEKRFKKNQFEFYDKP